MIHVRPECKSARSCYEYSYVDESHGPRGLFRYRLPLSVWKFAAIFGGTVRTITDNPRFPKTFLRLRSVNDNSKQNGIVLL